MVDPSRTGFAPYGAYELKATYQRNLMFGMLGAIILSALSVGVPAVISRFADSAKSIVIVDSIPAHDSIFIFVRPTPPPSIVHDPADVSVASPTDAALGGRVTMVPDSLLTDEPGDMLATQGEISGILGPGGQLGGSSQPDNLGVLDTSDAFPSPDSFIAMEIPPEMIASHTPDYPRLAGKLGLTGKVWVKALLDTLGRVRDARVAVSSGFDILDGAAVEAAYKNVFKPGIQNGRAVSCWVTYAVIFKAP